MMLPKLRLKVATDKSIVERSHGAVHSYRAYNFKHLIPQPAPGGLFCHVIFGPTKDYTCNCGIRHPHTIDKCPTCKVPIIRSTERSNRFGHIDTVVHYVNPLINSLVASVLGVSQKAFAEFAIGRHNFVIKQNDNGFLYAHDGTRYSFVLVPRDEENSFASVESLYQKMVELDIDGRTTLQKCKSASAKTYYELGYDFFDLFNSKVAVPPPTMRDVAVVNREITFHPVNNLYLRILRIGLRVQHLMDAGDSDVDILIPKESLVLQYLINLLYTDGAEDYYGNEIPSIVNKFGGKGGLIRGNLLGKRVDFSGRSVIVSGPHLNLDELGVPFDMAYELLKPHIIGELMRYWHDTSRTINPYKKAVWSYKNRTEEAIHFCYQCAKSARVMMNRAPSLHRYSVMAFKMVLHGGKAIEVPPMICKPFNADFDGDTVGLHLILTDEAMKEVPLISPEGNLMSSISFGSPNLMPSHEMTVGLYQMTL